MAKVLRAQADTLRDLIRKRSDTSMTLAPLSGDSQDFLAETLVHIIYSHNARDNPNLVPSYLDISDFDKDFSDAHGLWSLLTAIRQLEEAISDTIMATGSEAYRAALAVYHNVQAAANPFSPEVLGVLMDTLIGAVVFNEMRPGLFATAFHFILSDGA
ncbi:MAG: hypothetical protein LBK43_02990 [Treponema sp.]|jgi:hypothetical protein|nr:hypothetical protein [Treponema sp.]